MRTWKLLLLLLVVRSSSQTRVSDAIKKHQDCNYSTQDRISIVQSHRIGFDVDPSTEQNILCDDMCVSNVVANRTPRRRSLDRWPPRVGAWWRGDARQQQDTRGREPSWASGLAKAERWLHAAPCMMRRRRFLRRRPPGAKNKSIRFRWLDGLSILQRFYFFFHATRT